MPMTVRPASDRCPATPCEASTCKGRANYLKLKEIRKISRTSGYDLRFDLKRRFNYVKLKRISMVAT
jgi:hypothetical protein